MVPAANHTVAPTATLGPLATPGTLAGSPLGLPKGSQPGTPRNAPGVAITDVPATSPETPWRAILARDPFDSAALHGLARVLLRHGRRGEAIALLCTAGDDPAVLADLATQLAETGQRQAAADTVRRALAAEPADPALLGALGRTLLLLDQPLDALPILRRAHLAAPDDRDIATNLAAALIGAGNQAYRSGAMVEAEAAYRDAIALNPASGPAYSNLGNALTGQLRLEQAQEAFRAALRLDPANDETAFAFSLCLLLAGEHAEGWRLYERRRGVPALAPNYTRRPDLPRWKPGIPLRGRRVLLGAEQGMGDMIQYCRFAPTLGRMADAVMLEAPWPLAGLLAGMPGVDRVIGLEDAASGCDIMCPLLSLPLALAPGLVPGLAPDPVLEAGAAPPYLTAPAARMARWSAWLDRSSPGRRVGLVCSGDPGHPRDHARSIPLKAFHDLLDLPGISFVLVQTELRAADRVTFEAAANLRFPGAALTDYADTAGLLAGLDLLISVDTSAAHLAGALGRPVWTLLPYCPDYRWQLGRPDTGWYPSMRLYRQDRPGEWNNVIARVRDDLAAR